MVARGRGLLVRIACSALTAAGGAASAAVNIPTAEVGNAFNSADIGSLGDVDYTYRIGVHEVTNGQYAAFLNDVAASDPHGLWDSSMGDSGDLGGGIDRSGSSGSHAYAPTSGAADEPVRHVSFWDAARFANWLTNGQPAGAQGDGTTESGMYDLNGVTNPDNALVERERRFRDGASGVAVASQDEWYKAAYHDPGSGGPASDYWGYPTQSNNEPSGEAPPGGTNSANYDRTFPRLTEVGAYVDASSHYGTFDQGGNLWEWTDTIASASDRWARGGSLISDTGKPLSSDDRADIAADFDDADTGFRITSLEPVPEPAELGAILGGAALAVALAVRRTRRRR